MRKIQENAIIFRTGLDSVKNHSQVFAYGSESFFDHSIYNPMVSSFLQQLPRGSYIVDSRLSMLMPGWYPAIPGWHYDEIQRKPNGDLDFKNTNPAKLHYMLIYDFGSGSMTEFAKLRSTTIKSYDDLNKMMSLYEDDIVKVDHNSIYEFDCYDCHRAIPATGKGWRFFVRATRNTQREYYNEVRNQTQVYLPAIDVGW